MNQINNKGFKVKTLSRHPSHSVLRRELPEFEVRSLMRLGSTTSTSAAFPLSTSLGRRIIEINTVEAVKNSASKLLMKQKFTEAGVKTADWFITNGETWIRKNDEDTIMNLQDLPYPIIAKHIFGSRGTGNYKLNSSEEFQRWMEGRDLSKYLFEKFLKGYNREYRLHCTEDGCFYACRKLIKNDTPVDQRWSRHIDNSVWLTSENPKFDAPVNWSEIEAECVKALKALGADLLGFDVKVQTRLNKEGRVRENPEFAILESNSACSLASIGAQKYLEQIPILINKKINQ